MMSSVISAIPTLLSMATVIAILWITFAFFKKLNIRTCWFCGSVMLSIGLVACGNFVVVMGALLIPVFFELLYPTR